MKKVVLVMSFLLLAATATFADTSVQFFKKSQATRVVNYLNQNPEIMIYCACYDDYDAEYVYTTDVWMERYSFTYYEIWIYGFNVKTNEIVCTPIDLNCIWVRGSNGYPYSVAQELGFVNRVCSASFKWRMPTYRPQPRQAHPKEFHQTYTRQPNVEHRTPNNENYQARYVGKGNNQGKPSGNQQSTKPSNNVGNRGGVATTTSSNSNNNSGNSGRSTKPSTNTSNNNNGTNNNNNNTKPRTTTTQSSSTSSSSSSSRSTSTRR